MAKICYVPEVGQRHEHRNEFQESDDWNVLFTRRVRDVVLCVE